MQPPIGVRELALVDEEAGVRPACRHVVLDLIERYDDVTGRRLIQLEREKRRGQLAWHRDHHAWRSEGRARSGGAGGGRDDPRPVPVADARSMREQRVAIGEVRVGVQ